MNILVSNPLRCDGDPFLYEAVKTNTLFKKNQLSKNITLFLMFSLSPSGYASRLLSVVFLFCFVIVAK